MKYIFIVMSFLAPMFALAQNEKATKTYSDSTGKYLVSYHYDLRWATIPAVEGAQPHFDAMIQVYKLVPCRCGKPKTDTVAIGQPFTGIYVPNGCFEDSPAYWVKKAKGKPQ